jgi:hypothetical protein
MDPGGLVVLVEDTMPKMVGLIEGLCSGLTIGGTIDMNLLIRVGMQVDMI